MKQTQTVKINVARGGGHSASKTASANVNKIGKTASTNVKKTASANVNKTGKTASTNVNKIGKGGTRVIRKG